MIVNINMYKIALISCSSSKCVTESNASAHRNGITLNESKMQKKKSRERERDIYIYRERERERDRESKE